MTLSFSPLAASLVAASLVAAACATAARAGEAILPGAYEVAVHLEMSIGEDKPERRTLCLGETSRPARGLFILTAHTPISHCSVGNVRETEDRITFEILCEGPNAGSAIAEYRTAPGRFEGRIAMLMGGKNMRMTEVQVGRRVGECGADGRTSR